MAAPSRRRWAARGTRRCRSGETASRRGTAKTAGGDKGGAKGAPLAQPLGALLASLGEGSCNCTCPICCPSSQLLYLPFAVRRERLTRLEGEVTAAEAELAAVEGKSGELEQLEEQYWRDFGEFQLQLQEHLEEKAVLMHRYGAAAVVPGCAQMGCV